MVLPAGVDKATGLAAALGELGISPRETIGVGDAENDQACYSISAVFSAAVANLRRLPAIRSIAHMVTDGAYGRGVTELIERMLADDLPPLRKRATVSPL